MREVRGDMKVGKICYIMGKSASGKDSIFKELKCRFSEYKGVVLYTTRPIREGETDGVEYHFVEEDRLCELEREGRVIEQRAYQTRHGIWRYFTVDDGQIDLQGNNYLMIGTLESYEKMRNYFGKDVMVPVYVEVEDGERLKRALVRERMQKEPKYAEMCRRFLADETDFSEENLKRAGIDKKFQNMNLMECINEIGVYLQEEM